VQKFTDDALTECPDCGGDLRKIFGAPGIVLKGSGFYKTDTRAQDKRSSSDKNGSSSSDSSKSDTKAETSSSSDSSTKTDSAKPSTGADKPAKESKAASTSAS
jgi:predicted nucleic acid-binding Zn ribbon protein